MSHLLWVPYKYEVQLDTLETPLIPLAVTTTELTFTAGPITAGFQKTNSDIHVILAVFNHGPSDIRS